MCGAVLDGRLALDAWLAATSCCRCCLEAKHNNPAVAPCGYGEGRRLNLSRLTGGVPLAESIT